MKGFMKFCGILVAIALIIGVVLLAIGGMSGGLPKLIDQIKNGELSFGPEDFGWDAGWTTYSLGDGNMFNNDYEKIKDESVYETTYQATGVSSLSLNLGGCEVDFKTSPDAGYYIKAEKIGTFQSYVENGILHINGINAESGVFGKDNHMKIEILVPAETVFDSVEAELGAGTFAIDSLKADTVEIELGAGKLTADVLQATSFVGEVGAGQIIVENADITGDVAISVGAGELKLKGNIPGNLNAECGMGNMVITVLGSTEKDHNYDLECAAGNLQAGSHTISGLAGEKSIENGAASTYKLECALGNMTVTFQE